MEKSQISIDLKGGYTIHPLSLTVHPFGLDLDFDPLSLNAEKLYDTIEIDVVSVYDEEARSENDFYPVLLLIADEENIEEMRLENCSLKTIAYNIVDMLLNRMIWHGPYQTIKVRDSNMSSIPVSYTHLSVSV